MVTTSTTYINIKVCTVCPHSVFTDVCMTHNKQRLFPYRTPASWSLMEIVCLSEGTFEYLCTVPRNSGLRKVKQKGA
jgi:hypothetical protein